MAAGGYLEKVCNFLQERGVEEGVIEKLKDEKMDISAVLSANDDVLKDMGLSRAGDRLSLRGFCQEVQKNKEKDSTRKRLLEAFLSSKKDKSKKLENSGKQEQKKKLEKEKEKSKRVQIGWKHFREVDQIYAQVPLSRGGGTRCETMPLSSNKREVLRLCKSIFFPNGNSHYGKEEEMEFAIGNFQNVKMGVTLQVNGRDVPFSIENYMKAFKLKDVRLYLLSKKVESFSSSDESDDGDLTPMITPLITIDEFTTSEMSCTAGSSTVDREDKECSCSKDLIGTTEERASLKREQDMAYELSLETDRKKRIALEREEAETEHKKRVQEARAARVVAEPETDFVTVRVRHPIMGLCSRRFPTNSRMLAVYDWAGSLTPEIVDFTLCDPFGTTLAPSREVDDKCTIVMVSAPHTPSLCGSDDEIQFQGFGASSNSSNTTLPNCEPNIEETERDIEVSRTPLQLDEYYASILEGMPGTSQTNLSDSEDESNTTESHNDHVPAAIPDKAVSEVLNELAAVINPGCLTKFNIARNFIWEGTKRAVSRKSFSSANKISVKFTDDTGTSEGAIDWGGPMREFFTLILQYIHDSNLMCGPENSRFLSYSVRCLEDNDYFVAGLMIAMSLVHGGPAPHFFSPIMFEALITDQHLAVSLQDVYDHELKSSLQALHDVDTVDKARRCTLEGNLATVLDLAGTLAMPIKTLHDAKKIIASTTHWFVLGRCGPSLVSFRNGLSALGVLEAVKKYPDSFRPLFCDEPEKLTAERMEQLFRSKTSPVGSSKALTESLVLSRWSDYLQDVEDKEETDITLSDILFFATGCKEMPQRGISPTIEFLHEPESWGSSRFPTANTCSCILRLPVIHDAYENFKADMTFGILNGRGFGSA